MIKPIFSHPCLRSSHSLSSFTLSPHARRRLPSAAPRVAVRRRPLLVASPAASRRLVVPPPPKLLPLPERKKTSGHVPPLPKLLPPPPPPMRLGLAPPGRGQGSAMAGERVGEGKARRPRSCPRRRPRDENMSDMHMIKAQAKKESRTPSELKPNLFSSPVRTAGPSLSKTDAQTIYGLCFGRSTQ